MSIAYIGIGSNLGDRKANIEEAITRMKKEKGFQVLRLSSLYESDPWGLKDQSRFLNGVVEVESTLPPKVLLLRLLSIETDMGRMRDRKWGPRVIDLDLLLYDKVIIKESVKDGIVVPHPEMHRRNFVLIPLIELAPDTIHPKNKQPLKKLLHLLKINKSYGRVEIYLG
jgi:2-amino-4-hydroxy-6-hydroxymethyldihydropteridine diphosphokinase